MSPVREIALIVQRELLRNLRSAKGIVLALLCVLGGTGTTLGGLSTRRYYAEAGAEGIHKLREQGLTAAYGKEIGRYLADAPEVMIGMMAGTFWLSALLAALIGFDSVSGDIQYRAVRYWTVRSRRSSYVAGKFLGMFAVATSMTLLMHLCSWIAIITRSDTPVDQVISWGLRLWLVTLPVSAAWCALVTFFSSMFRTPILALLVSCFAWMVLGLAYAFGKLAEKDAITWVYPNGFDRLLLSPSADKLFSGVGAAMLFGAVFVGAGVVLFQRRDV
jgi:ABC-type transport system involved in multi-copper enzyme maturation permease subunit